MDQQERGPQIRRLEALLGEWSIEATFPSAPPSGPIGRVVFEWMVGERFLVERWAVDVPEAPDGLAIIGFDDDRELYLQHYFDSRGVARVYEMSLGDRIWRLWRDAPGFSQRFAGAFSDDGDVIEGQWEISEDGERWRHDFDLRYTRSRPGPAAG
jgi:hypothetical protein